MSFSPFSQNGPLSVTSAVVVEPIFNALMAMSLLTTPNLDAQSEPWLAEIASRLTPKQRQTNRIIFEWFGSMLLHIPNHNSFPNVYTAIGTESPVKLRDRILQGWLDRFPDTDETPRSLLADQQRFVAFAESATGDSEPDREHLSEVHQLISDPPALQALVVDHLRTLWEAHFANEWDTKLSMMRLV